MAVVQTTWQCPCCGAMLAVVGPSEPPEEWELQQREGSPTKRGGRPRGSRNKPKGPQLVEPGAGGVGVAKGGD